MLYIFRDGVEMCGDAHKVLNCEYEIISLIPKHVKVTLKCMNILSRIFLLFLFFLHLLTLHITGM